MLGAIAGDIIGSPFEFNNYRKTDFPLFFISKSKPTDDSILTLAVADALMNDLDLVKTVKSYALNHKTNDINDPGFGGMFLKWIHSDSLDPYNSFGNGSGMRVSSVGWLYDDINIVDEKAKETAEITHNHPEGIKGAQAIATAIFLARNGQQKSEIGQFIITNYGYDLKKSIDEIRPNYRFDATCQGSVPVAIRAFLESEGFEHAIRLAVSVGGDSDTIACMTGSIAEAFYGGVPPFIRNETLKILPNNYHGVLKQFETKVKRQYI